MVPRSLKRLSGYYRPYGSALGLAALLMLVAALSQAGLVFLIEHVLDSGLIARDEQVLRSIPWLLFGLYVVKGLAVSGRAYLIHRAGFGVAKTLRIETFRSLLRQDRRWHQRQASADWVSRLSADISHVEGLAHALTGMVEKPLTILALLGSALWLDWRLTLAVLGVLPVLALAVVGFAKRQGVATQEALNGRANLSKNAQESLDGVLVIQAFHGESARARVFGEKALFQERLRMREAISRFVPGPVVEALAALGIGLVIAYGGQRVVAGSIQPGELMAFLVALGLLNVPFKGLVQVTSDLERARAGARAAFAVIDREPELSAGGELLESGPCSIVFQDFSIEARGTKLFRDLTMEVQPGERIAVVGPSGVGKSSLLATLLRFGVSYSGEIRIQDKQLEAVDVANLRKAFAWVSQDDWVFEGTVAENLRLGRPGASDEDLRAAASVAQADSFIRELPDGYQTQIGTSGEILSGGELQRICIARALVAGRGVLLLDEATAALDGRTESCLFESLGKLEDRPTVFFVSHRFETLKHADRVLVITGDGQAIVGAHTDLMRHESRYRRLFGAR